MSSKGPCMYRIVNRLVREEWCEKEREESSVYRCGGREEREEKNIEEKCKRSLIQQADERGPKLRPLILIILHPISLSFSLPLLSRSRRRCSQIRRPCRPTPPHPTPTPTCLPRRLLPRPFRLIPRPNPPHLLPPLSLLKVLLPPRRPARPTRRRLTRRCRGRLKLRGHMRAFGWGRARRVG